MDLLGRDSWTESDRAKGRLYSFFTKTRSAEAYHYRRAISARRFLEASFLSVAKQGATHKILNVYATQLLRPYNPLLEQRKMQDLLFFTALFSILLLSNAQLICDSTVLGFPQGLHCARVIDKMRFVSGPDVPKSPAGQMRLFVEPQYLQRPFTAITNPYGRSAPIVQLPRIWKHREP